MKPQFRISDTDSVCKMFKTMGNENRLGILSKLISGEASVGDLEKSLGIKQPNLSHELKKLRDIGLVTTRRESKVIFYTLVSEEVAAFVGGVLEMVSGEKIKLTTLGSQALHKPNSSIQNNNVLPETRALAHPQRTGEYGKFPVVRH